MVRAWASSARMHGRIFLLMISKIDCLQTFFFSRKISKNTYVVYSTRTNNATDLWYKKQSKTKPIFLYACVLHKHGWCKIFMYFLCDFMKYVFIMCVCVCVCNICNISDRICCCCNMYNKRKRVRKEPKCNVPTFFFMSVRILTCLSINMTTLKSYQGSLCSGLFYIFIE